MIVTNDANIGFKVFGQYTSLLSTDFLPSLTDT